jgi:hypothetical protein
VKEQVSMLFPRRSAIVLSIAAVVVIALPILGSGCGSAPTEFDNAANYTPESLAQEVILRYRALSPKAKTAERRNKKTTVAAQSRISKKAAVTKTKGASGPTTIDNVLDDIESKLTLVKGTTPAETTKKMIETISGDSTLPDADKKALTEYVGRMAD